MNQHLGPPTSLSPLAAPPNFPPSCAKMRESLPIAVRRKREASVDSNDVMDEATNLNSGDETSSAASFASTEEEEPFESYHDDIDFPETQAIGFNETSTLLLAPSHAFSEASVASSDYTPASVPEPSVLPTEPALEEDLLSESYEVPSGRRAYLGHARHAPSGSESGRRAAGELMLQPFPLRRLPRELREHIYGFVLCSPRPILPHLCDATAPSIDPSIPRFHDDNQKPHNAVFESLSILFVSKSIRAEALPVFYAVNTFSVGTDTASFFDRLAWLGRFDLVRNVRFTIPHRMEKRASDTLSGMASYLRAKVLYEDSLRATAQHHAVLRQSYGRARKRQKREKADKPSTGALVGRDLATLTAHPQYFVGGLQDLNIAICLAKLCSAATPSPLSASSSTSTSPNQAYPHIQSMLSLPVPNSTPLSEYSSLSWFPLVTSGLGISLRLVPGVPLDATGPGFIAVTWRQRWEKRRLSSNTHDDPDDAGGNSNGKESSSAFFDPREVQRRALLLDPSAAEVQADPHAVVDLNAHQHNPLDPHAAAPAKAQLFYRVNCGGGIRWFRIPDVGPGGVIEGTEA